MFYSIYNLVESPNRGRYTERGFAFLTPYSLFRVMEPSADGIATHLQLESRRNERKANRNQRRIPTAGNRGSITLTNNDI